MDFAAGMCAEGLVRGDGAGEECGAERVGITAVEEDEGLFVGLQRWDDEGARTIVRICVALLKGRRGPLLRAQGEHV